MQERLINGIEKQGNKYILSNRVVLLFKTLLFCITRVLKVAYDIVFC